MGVISPLQGGADTAPITTITPTAAPPVVAVAVISPSQPQLSPEDEIQLEADLRLAQIKEELRQYTDKLADELSNTYVEWFRIRYTFSFKSDIIYKSLSWMIMILISVTHPVCNSTTGKKICGAVAGVQTILLIILAISNWATYDLFFMEPKQPSEGFKIPDKIISETVFRNEFIWEKSKHPRIVYSIYEWCIADNRSLFEGQMLSELEQAIIYAEHLEELRRRGVYSGRKLNPIIVCQNASQLQESLRLKLRAEKAAQELSVQQLYERWKIELEDKKERFQEEKDSFQANSIVFATRKIRTSLFLNILLFFTIIIGFSYLQACPNGPPWCNLIGFPSIAFEVVINIIVYQRAFKPVELVSRPQVLASHTEHVAGREYKLGDDEEVAREAKARHAKLKSKDEIEEQRRAQHTSPLQDDIEEQKQEKYTSPPSKDDIEELQEQRQREMSMNSEM